MSNKDGIPFDGFRSVLEMLDQADHAFREKILGNIRRRDPNLARRLEIGLHAMQERDNNRHALQRGQRIAQTRNYGQ